jgi:hypothetical protein
MSEDLRTHIQMLKGLMPQVNTLADEAAETIREVEAILGGENLPVEADVVVTAVQTSPKTTDYVSLAFKRITPGPDGSMNKPGKFRIAIVKERKTSFVNDQGFAESSLKLISQAPWLESPRDEKLFTFPCLPALLEQIGKNVAELIEAMQKAKPAVKAILNTMK